MSFANKLIDYFLKKIFILGCLKNRLKFALVLKITKNSVLAMFIYFLQYVNLCKIVKKNP